jgi:hypothetical protein
MQCIARGCQLLSTPPPEPLLLRLRCIKSSVQRGLRFSRIACSRMHLALHIIKESSLNVHFITTVTICYGEYLFVLTGGGTPLYWMPPHTPHTPHPTPN